MQQRTLQRLAEGVLHAAEIISRLHPSCEYSSLITMYSYTYIK
jgi:hypothetical protein